MAYSQEIFTLPLGGRILIIVTCDFVTYEMPQENGELQRAHILFFENLATREVWCGGIVVNPDAQWMAQVARNQTDCFSGKLLNFRYLIHDGDPLSLTQGGFGHFRKVFFR